MNKYFSKNVKYINKVYKLFMNYEVIRYQPASLGK